MSTRLDGPEGHLLEEEEAVGVVTFWGWLGFAKVDFLGFGRRGSRFKTGNTLQNREV